MAVNQQQVQQALEAHDRLKKSTEIPLFYGDEKKDTILPSVLIERVERARRTANWTEVRTCDEFLACLREKAIHWHKGFESLQVNDRVWQEVRDYFLETYEPKFSARMTCTNFQDLKQQSGEKVHDFFDRVNLVFKRLCESRPAAMVNVRRVQAPAPIVPAPGANAADIAAAEAHNANAMTQPQNDAANKMEGIEDAQWFFLRQLFIAGLKDTIRSEVMKAGHENLREVLNDARATETVLEDAEKKTKAITVLQTEGGAEQEYEDDDFLDNLDEDELEVINMIRTRNGRAPFRKRPFRRNGQGRPRQRVNPAMVICRFCKKSGHMQRECQVRLKSGGAMVDATGKPLRRINQVDLEEEETQPGGLQDRSVDSVARMINTLNW